MKEDTTHIDPTWMEQTGGYAKDMTLRDYFAANALQGIIASLQVDQEINATPASQWAYKVADFMLKARKA